eukprot:s1469_g6.t3
MSCRKTEYPQSAVSSAISSDPGISGASGNKGLEGFAEMALSKSKLDRHRCFCFAFGEIGQTWPGTRLSSFSSFKSYVEHMLERRF